MKRTICLLLVLVASIAVHAATDTCAAWIASRDCPSGTFRFSDRRLASVKCDGDSCASACCYATRSLTLTRSSETASGVVGRLKLAGSNLVLHTLERSKSDSPPCIPDGIYSATFGNYKRHSYLSVMLKNVTDRANAFIQTGTYASDVHGGSILIGTGSAQDVDAAGKARSYVTGSLDALDKLLEALNFGALYDDGSVCRADPRPHNCKATRVSLAGDGTLEDYQGRALLTIRVEYASDFATNALPTPSRSMALLSRLLPAQAHAQHAIQPQATYSGSVHSEFECDSFKAKAILSSLTNIQAYLSAAANVPMSRFELHYSGLRAKGGYFVFTVTSVGPLKPTDTAKSSKAIIDHLIASPNSLRKAMNVTKATVTRVCGPCSNTQSCNVQTLECDALPSNQIRTWNGKCNPITETCPHVDVEIWAAPKHKDDTKVEISFTAAGWHTNGDRVELVEWRDCDIDRSCDSRAKPIVSVAVPTGAAGLINVANLPVFCSLWLYRDHRGNILERLGRWGRLCCDGKATRRKCYGGACITSAGKACAQETCSQQDRRASDLIVDEDGNINVDVTDLGDLNDPENPNSPLNPGNPNYDPTIDVNDDDIGDLNDPTNPKSPLNPKNPNSPLNPENPKSPLNPNRLNPDNSKNSKNSASGSRPSVASLAVVLLAGVLGSKAFL